MYPHPRFNLFIGLAGVGWLCLLATGQSRAEPSANPPVVTSAPGASAKAALTTAPSTPTPTEIEIQRMLRRLHDPSFSSRKEAIRTFAAWGPVAFPALRSAAAGDNFEAALAARTLLAELEPAVLLGARARLEADRTRLAWDEPLTLRILIEPAGHAPMRLPWPVPPAPATQPAESDAVQVAALLDAAELIRVLDPAGEPVELRIDLIDNDPAVARAVHQRAGDAPPEHQVPAGVSPVLTVPAFNRGWARYPLLKAGRYTVQFDYQPEWRDPDWTAEGFGRVRSEPLSIEITTAAPEPILRADRPLDIALHAVNDQLVGRITSRWDRPIWINLNFGPDPRRDAQCRWALAFEDGDASDDWEQELPPTGPHVDRFRRLAPGEFVDLPGTPLTVLTERTRRAAPNPAGLAHVQIRYAHLATTPELRQAWKGRLEPHTIPSALYVGTLSSHPVVLDLNTARLSTSQPAWDD